jgi:hypothetical protein
MPGFPLTAASVLCCLHQAPTKTAVTQQAVTILGQPATTVVSPINVIGCPFAPSAPQPCLTVLWEMASAKVTVQGQPLRLMPPPGAGPGPGKCLGPAPQGIPDMKSNQTKVIVT